MKYTTYVGSYTGDARTDGIHIFESDAETGDFRTMRVIDTLRNPTYMALNRACTRLYTVCDCPDLAKGWLSGGLAAFAVEGQGDRLAQIDRVLTGWGTACHVSLDPAERAVVYADYGSGTAGYVDDMLLAFKLLLHVIVLVADIGGDDAFAVTFLKHSREVGNE